jgi:hypothetical protein
VSFSFTHAESAYSFLCQLDGGGFSACTSPTAYSALSSGSHTFQVEAKGADGAVTSVASYTWTVDATAPTQALALASGASGAFLGGGATLYYRGSASGAFQFVDTVTDSGSGSASATYPAISATGWTHAGETITTPAGGPYTSSAFSWTASPANPTYSVTAKDAVGNSTSTSVTFVNDTSAPSGGALTVGGATAGGSGALVYSSSASFAIGARTDYAEAQSASQSGLASSVLTVQSETLSGGACGTPGSGGPFVSAQTISGTTQPSGIVTGYCYLYTLTGTDKVGNSALISATVAVDTTAPSTPTLTFSGTTNAFYNAGTLYFRPAPGGAYTVSAASSDAESGVASYTFSSLAANNFTVSQSAGQASYTFGASATQPGSAATVSAANLAGLSSGNASYTLISDTTAPSGGALTVNGTAASAAGTSSATTSTAFTIASRTDYSETQSATQSGLRSSALTVQSETLTGSTCGTPGSGGPFTSAQSVSATTQPSGIQGGYCYLYTLTGTDNVGNAATVKTTVAVDIAIASMSIANHSGGTAGKAEAGDALTVVFNGPIAVASMCSTWSGNTSNQSLSANNDVTVTIADGGILGGNDALTVASATCTFQLGTIDLGSSAYVSVANATFSGSGTSASTITYTASTFTLVVKLGAKGGLGLVGTVSSSAATLSPNANLTGIDTNHPPSFTTANVPQF